MLLKNWTFLKTFPDFIDCSVSFCDCPLKHLRNTIDEIRIVSLIKSHLKLIIFTLNSIIALNDKNIGSRL